MLLRNLTTSAIELNDLDGITVPPSGDYDLRFINSETIFSSEDLLAAIQSGSLVFVDNSGVELSTTESENLLLNSSPVQPSINIHVNGSPTPGNPHHTLNFITNDIAPSTTTAGVINLTLDVDHAAWGRISGNLADQTDLTAELSQKANTIHSHTKADITDFSDSDYATAAQGVLADTALQPGDNISALTNDSGYITSETDPIFSASAASSITTTDITNWNSAFSWGDHSGLYANVAHSHISLDISDFSSAVATEIASLSISDIGNVSSAPPQTQDILSFDGTNWTPTPISSLVPPPQVFFGHNGSRVQTLSRYYGTTIYTTNKVPRSDDIFLIIGPGEVLVTQDGWYEVQFSISAEATTSWRTGAEHWLEINKMRVEGSTAWTYHRVRKPGQNTGTSTVIVNLNANDVIRVQSKITVGRARTLKGGCRLLIKRLS